MTTGSVDGFSVLPETQFVGTRRHLDNTQVFSERGFIPPKSVAGERPEFDVKPPLGAPHLTCPRNDLLKSFPQEDTSARQLGYEIRAFPLLDEPMAIELHLPVCQLYHWQLGPNMWSCLRPSR